MPIPVQDLQGKPDQPTNNAPAIDPVVDPNLSPTPTPTPEDIVARASSVTLDDGTPTIDPNADIITDAGFDRNKWNEMLTALPPEQRQQLESAYKSLQGGADKKFQKAAEMLKQAQGMGEQPWTPERVRQLSQDPAFVQAAQSYAQNTQTNAAPDGSGLTDDEYSNLSDVEKAKFNQLTQNQQVLQSQLDTILLSQEDEKLTQRYKNYDASQVGTLRQQFIKGQVRATSEHLWKVLDYEPAIQRAYKLGLQDRQLEIQPKVDANPVAQGGVQITPSGDTPVKTQGENTVSFFRRLAIYNQQRLAKAQGKQQ